MRSQIQRSLTIIRRFEEQVTGAIEDGRLPQGMCQGSIYLDARDKIVQMLNSEHEEAALDYALEIIDAYRSDMMPRVDGATEVGSYGFVHEVLIEGRPSVIVDTLSDLERLDSMTPAERNKWYASLSPLERKQMARMCGMFVGLSMVEPLIDMQAALERAQREGKQAHRRRSTKRRR